MAGPSWLVDGNRFATKIKSASGTCNPGKINFKSNPCRACPKCDHVIDNSDVIQEWPGLPRGVKFDPSDQEIIWHLLAKSGCGDQKPHSFIDEFIPTLNGEDGICYTHPQNLPGVKQDGSTSHFFHRSVKAYNTGTRKRRKIHDDDLGDVRWHKTGKTASIFLGSEQRGCKKIMVLYAKPVGGGTSVKTNWKLHQYHLGTEEEEKDGEFVISKVFYDQQQQAKTNEKNLESILNDVNDEVAVKVDPVTPKSVTPKPRTERRSSYEPRERSIASFSDSFVQEHVMRLADTMQPEMEIESRPESHLDEEAADCNNDQAGDDTKWWDSESQYLIDSQQLVEALSLCDDLLQSQSPNRDGLENGAVKKKKPSLSDYAQLGAEQFKKDLQDCQSLDKKDLHGGRCLDNKDLQECLDPADIDIDTPPDFRLSQLEFESQDSYVAWGQS
uniref:NAC domain-containing protein n=1 Tax=Tamarix hispida TaxID=189793 RepID=I6YDR8_9CARY|nr:NAC domain-containing protein [Tamarix hispida]